MKRLVYRGLKKWIYLIFLGLVMYFLGYIVAQVEIIKRDQSTLRRDELNIG